MLSDDVTVSALVCEMGPWLRRTLPPAPMHDSGWKPRRQKKRRRRSATSVARRCRACCSRWRRAIGRSVRLRRLVWGKSTKSLSFGKVIDALGGRFTDVHRDVCDHSAWALGEIEDATAVAPLLSALNDSDARVRARVAWALGEIEHPSAVNGLVAALEDSDAAVREKSIWALGEIESDLAVDDLVLLLTDTDALKESDWRVRRTAAWALREIDDPSVIDELRAAAGDSNSDVRRAIAQALRQLGERRYKRE